MSLIDMPLTETLTNAPGPVAGLQAMPAVETTTPTMQDRAKAGIAVGLLTNPMYGLVAAMGDNAKELGNQALELYPDVAAVVGGALGVTAGAPTGPATSLGLGVLAAEGLRQGTSAIVDAIQGRDKSVKQRAEESVDRIGIDALVQTAVPVVGKPLGVITRTLATNSKAAAVAKDLVAGDIDLSGAAKLIGAKSVQGFLHVMETLPFSGGWVQNALARTEEGIAKFAKSTAELAGKTEAPYEAGEIIRRGVGGKVADAKGILHVDSGSYVGRMRAAAANEYEKASVQTITTPVEDATAIPSGRLAAAPGGGGFADFHSLNDVATDFTTTQQAAAELKALIKTPANHGPVVGVLDAILSAPDTLTLAEARSWRSELSGVSRNLSDALSGTAKSSTPQLTQILDSAIEKAGKNAVTGNPAAFAALRKGDAITKDMYATLEHLSDVRDGANGIAAWNAAGRQMNADPTLMLNLKKALTPFEWNEYIGARVRDMGMETVAKTATAVTSGAEIQTVRQFSEEKFIKSWLAMSDKPELLNAAFGKVGTPLRDNLELLAEISKVTSESANKSYGLIGRAIVYTSLGALGTATVGAVASGNLPSGPTALGATALTGTGLIGARLLTYAPFVKWLAETGAIHPANFRGFAAQIARLATLAAADSAHSEDINTYLKAMSENNAVEQVRQVLTGKAISSMQEAQKPLLARFQESRALYSAQAELYSTLSKSTQSQLASGLSNERKIGATMLTAGKQIDQLQSLEESIAKAPPDAGTNANLVKIRDAKNRIARGALNTRDAVYAKS